MLKKKKRQKLNNTNFILFTFKSSYFQDLSKFMNILSLTLLSNNKLNKKAIINLIKLHLFLFLFSLLLYNNII